MIKLRDLPESTWLNLAKQSEGDATKLAFLARGAKDAKLEQLAYRLAKAAREAAPGDPAIHAETVSAIAASVPGWHFKMLGEEARNQAYAAAIAHAVEPGMRVLDIGSGSGLLAMIAARAGAAHVYSCEANPVIAEAATEIVALNGLADRVTVLAKHSNALDPDMDLGGKVDLLVSEVLGSAVLGEGVLETIADARTRLLRPEGAMVPRRAEIRVALARWEKLARRSIGNVLDFDLSPFNRLASTPFRVSSASQAIELAGAPATLFDFDFGRFKAEPGAASVSLVATGGRADGVVQWMRIVLDDAVSFENLPGAGIDSAWYLSFFPFDRPRTLAPGAQVAAHGRHSRDSFWLWTDA